MKRDMDLVRDILIQVESAGAPIDADSLGRSDDERQRVCYHIDLMKAHGLLDASVRTIDTKDGFTYAGGLVYGLTWDGCDYLDAMRDEKVWKRTKKAVEKAVGSTTMEMFKKAALMVTEQAIRAGIGG